MLPLKLDQTKPLANIGSTMKDIGASGGQASENHRENPAIPLPERPTCMGDPDGAFYCRIPRVQRQQRQRRPRWWNGLGRPKPTGAMALAMAGSKPKMRASLNRINQSVAPTMPMLPTISAVSIETTAVTTWIAVAAPTGRLSLPRQAVHHAAIRLQ